VQAKLKVNAQPATQLSTKLVFMHRIWQLARGSAILDLNIDRLKSHNDVLIKLNESRSGGNPCAGAGRSHRP
jgi:hypothetical protein